MITNGNDIYINLIIQCANAQCFPPKLDCESIDASANRLVTTFARTMRHLRSQQTVYPVLTLNTVKTVDLTTKSLQVRKVFFRRKKNLFAVIFSLSQLPQMVQLMANQIETHLLVQSPRWRHRQRLHPPPDTADSLTFIRAKFAVKRLAKSSRARRT